MIIPFCKPFTRTARSLMKMLNKTVDIEQPCRKSLTLNQSIKNSFTRTHHDISEYNDFTAESILFDMPVADSLCQRRFLPPESNAFRRSMKAQRLISYVSFEFQWHLWDWIYNDQPFCVLFLFWKNEKFNSLKAKCKDERSYTLKIYCSVWELWPALFYCWTYNL